MPQPSILKRRSSLEQSLLETQYEKIWKIKKTPVAPEKRKIEKMARLLGNSRDSKVLLQNYECMLKASQVDCDKTKSLQEYMTCQLSRPH